MRVACATDPTFFAKGAAETTGGNDSGRYAERDPQASPPRTRHDIRLGSLQPPVHRIQPAERHHTIVKRRIPLCFARSASFAAPKQRRARAANSTHQLRCVLAALLATARFQGRRTLRLGPRPLRHRRHPLVFDTGGNEYLVHAGDSSISPAGASPRGGGKMDLVLHAAFEAPDPSFLRGRPRLIAERRGWSRRIGAPTRRGRCASSPRGAQP